MTSLGMLLYACIVSAGYYGEKREYPPAAAFALLASLTAVMLGARLRDR